MKHLRGKQQPGGITILKGGTNSLAAVRCPRCQGTVTHTVSEDQKVSARCNHCGVEVVTKRMSS